MNESTSARNNQILTYQVNQNTLNLSGSLTIKGIDIHRKQLMQRLKSFSGDSLILDLAGCDKIDSAGVVLISQIEKILARRSINMVLQNIPENIDQTMKTFSLSDSLNKPAIEKPGLLEDIGDKVYRFLKITFRDYIYQMADLFYWSLYDLMPKRKAHRKGEFINQSVLIGVNAVPIIALISLLIGLVLALQSAAQLRQFGANIFMVDLIVIAMTREMGPLITAIMIAGRSGSAIASEIGTMVITEEVDALRSMALNPIRYVVVPKMHASIFTLPFLTILADLMGILGGMIVSYFYLDLSVPTFYNRMASVLFAKDIFIGTFKSIVFGVIIVQTAAYYGFHVRGGADAVGRFTTAAVVTSIFLVIFADSIIGLIFY